MEVVAAMGSAATVVQLVDFAGRLIKTTASFCAALAEASKELEILHRRIDHLGKLFENTRALACSYQNSKLAIEPQNQQTLELLGQALTVCSIDLQSLNKTLQKPLSQTDWRILRIKRRFIHVCDEGTLRHLSLRLEGDINLLNGLLSSINMHNDSVIHGSIERVANLVEQFPNVSEELAAFSSRQDNTHLIVDRLDKVLERLKFVDKETTTGQELVADPEPMWWAKPTEIAAIRMDTLMAALELFAPAFRTGLQFMYNDLQVHVSKEAMCWLSSEFYEVVGEVHSAAARSHLRFLTEEQEPGLQFEDVLMPRRFYRQNNLQKHPLRAYQIKRRSTATTIDLNGVPEAGPDVPFRNCCGFVATSSGKLYADFEGTHQSKEWPSGELDSGRISMAFVPKTKLGLPGIAIIFMKTSERTQGTHHAFLTTFNVLPSTAPIIQAVKEGDRGLSRVLQALKLGEAWAGDRDENGRSLLSHAVESGSRDMCLLLFRMGAHPQDAHSMKQLQFAPVRQRAPVWSDK